MKLLPRFHTADYADEAETLDNCVFSLLRGLQFSLAGAKTADLVTLMDSLWMLEVCGEKELINVLSSIWVELLNRDTNKLMQKVVAQIAGLPSVSEENMTESQTFCENLLLRVCVPVLESVKYTEG